MLDEHDRALIRRALEEDLSQHGDVTSQAIFGPVSSRLLLLSKASGILAGAAVFSEVYREVDQATRVEFVRRDGERLEPGDLVARVTGPTGSLLTAERTAINFLALLSGIATETRRYVDAAAGRSRILDTRKTIPGFRTLSKYAVRVGGGTNHRMGLFDMVLIKDNHIDEAGSITGAVELVRRSHGSRFRIEVECRSVEDVREALACRVDIIMLDNMDDETMARCVALRDTAVSAGGDTIEFEASGNMSLERIDAVARTGVDSISIGALTHSVRSFDFSLKAEKKARPT
jgi:nicotinate-nucleotide pyrophosphorylase (carboxylating)